MPSPLARPTSLIAVRSNPRPAADEAPLRTEHPLAANQQQNEKDECDKSFLIVRHADNTNLSAPYFCRKNPSRHILRIDAG